MTEENACWVDFDTMEAFMVDVFKGIGVPEEDARTCADVLITADKRGIDSHGVGRLKTIYYDRIVKHKIQEPDFSEISDVTLFDLVAAFRSVVAAKPDAPVHRIHEINVSLEEQMRLVLDMVKEKSRMEFTSLFNEGEDRLVLIVTFIAVLELIKQKHLKVSQSEDFGQIIVEYIDG